MAAMSSSYLPNLLFEPYLINIRCSKLEVCNTTRSTITEEPFSRYSESQIDRLDV